MYFVLHSRCPICRLSGVRIVDLAGSRYWIDGMGRLPDRMCSCRCSVLCTGCIVRVCLLAGLVLFFYLEHQIGTGMKAKGIENLDYIVVLGCQVKGTKPSKALKDRLDTAKEYMQANPETIAVLSGGQGKMEEISEAECMRRYLEKAGISRERLILEQRSTTTRQNLRYSRRYMDYRHDEIGIITNNFHVYRSVLLARRSGYQRVCGIAAPCKSVLLYHYLVREAFALAREMLHKR